MDWPRTLMAIGESLPIAVGLLLAAMPMVIIAVVVVSKRPAPVARAFVGGWLLGLTVAGAIVIAVEDLLTLGSDPAWWVAYAKITVGVVLVFLAVKKWLGRARPTDTPQPPRWMSAVDSLGPWQAVGLACAMAALNPKHLVLVVAGATVIAAETPHVPEQLIALLVFVLVASVGVAAPLLVTIVLGARSGPLLTAADDWMTTHSATIMSAVLLALGVIILANGVNGLLTPT